MTVPFCFGIAVSSSRPKKDAAARTRATPQTGFPKSAQFPRSRNAQSNGQIRLVTRIATRISPDSKILARVRTSATRRPIWACCDNRTTSADTGASRRRQPVAPQPALLLCLGKTALRMDCGTTFRAALQSHRGTLGIKACVGVQGAASCWRVPRAVRPQQIQPFRSCFSSCPSAR